MTEEGDNSVRAAEGEESAFEARPEQGEEGSGFCEGGCRSDLSQSRLGPGKSSDD